MPDESHEEGTSCQGGGGVSPYFRRIREVRFPKCG